MTGRAKSSGPISRVSSSSVQIARLVPDDDGKAVIGAEPIQKAGPDVAALMARVRERAADVVPFERRVDAILVEQQQIVDQAGPDPAPGSDPWLANEVLSLLDTVKRFLPNWSPETRTAIALAIRAGALLERQELSPVEPTVRTALETRERRQAGRDAYNAGQTARADRNRLRARCEAARLWADNPDLTLDFVGRDIEVRQVELLIEPRLVRNRKTEEDELRAVRFDTIAKDIRDLRQRKSRKAR